jgi:hypothetical protein
MTLHSVITDLQVWAWGSNQGGPMAGNDHDQLSRRNLIADDDLVPGRVLTYLRGQRGGFDASRTPGAPRAAAAGSGPVSAGSSRPEVPHDAA